MADSVPTATSIVNFLTIVENIHSKDMFRGQGNIAWPVLPSLARKIDCLRDSMWHFNTWLEIEEHLLDEFKRLSAPWLTFTPQGRFEWLVLAQHHGLPTVLLDWTTNPLKALFFAVEDHSLDQFDGAVFGFEPFMGWYTSTDRIKDSKDDKDLVCFYPKHIDQRLVSQEACFVAFPFPNGIEPFELLTVYDESKDDLTGCLDQILIPASAKPRLRKELATMGITHQTLFPGLDGIAKTTRRTLGWP